MAKARSGLAAGQDRLRVVVALHGPVPVVEAIAKITHLAVRVAHVPAGDERLLEVGPIVAIGVFEIKGFGAVLNNRTTAIEGDRKEPWTWVRTHGKGRVFYTAWGHDQRTWSNPGFQNLVERGIRWAVGADPAIVPAFSVGQDSGLPKVESAVATGETPAPQMTAKRTDIQPLQYVEAKVPFYPPNGPRRGDGEWNKMQQPLTAEESMKHFVMPVGFEVKLFVAEPQLEGKPIYMTWDERGRLWVCETYDYPNELQPVGEGRDKIRICEDTDGDGRADKFMVFAEKLSIPTTIA
ncbi:MAG: ThuA domain-containing protein, partial [Planctomycetia bacterium]|nr:ThuA domain-containing protein [Planctomycetia bacterium]